MNIEKLYDLARENLLILCRGYVKECKMPQTGDALYEEVIKDHKKFSSWYPALAPALEIYTETREELLKSKGGTVYSALKRIVKRAGISRMQGTWTDASGRCCACSGYHAVRLFTHVEGFDNVEGIDLDKAFPLEETLDAEIHMPTHGELRANKVKDKSNRKRYLYDFGDGLPMVDASLLEDVMDCLPRATAYVKSSDGELSTIYLKSDRGDGIVLPVRKQKAT
jgi:hypothetical protein